MSEIQLSEVSSGNSSCEILYRLITAEDIDTVMEIERKAHSHPWRRSSFEDCLQGRQKCWLAIVKNEIRGYIVVAHGGGDAELLNVVVAPAWQRKGLGRQMLEHAVKAVEAHADMLFLEVRVSNHRAIELYSAEGFFEVGHRKNYYPTVNGHEDALLMARQL
jgi:ribosomal-protein-alanine N-acetyltransferase